jgi:hypothetical protein
MQTPIKTYKFIGKVLSDGHLSIPEEITKESAKEFEVTLTPVDDIKKTIQMYLAGRIEKSGKLKDIALDSAEIEKAAKEAFGTTDIDIIMEAVRK